MKRSMDWRGIAPQTDSMKALADRLYAKPPHNWRGSDRSQQLIRYTSPRPHEHVVGLPRGSSTNERIGSAMMNQGVRDGHPLHQGHPAVLTIEAGVST